MSAHVGTVYAQLSAKDIIATHLLCGMEIGGHYSLYPPWAQVKDACHVFTLIGDGELIVDEAVELLHSLQKIHGVKVINVMFASDHLAWSVCA